MSVSIVENQQRKWFILEKHIRTIAGTLCFRQFFTGDLEKRGDMIED